MQPLGFSQAMADRQSATTRTLPAYIFICSEESNGAGGQDVTYAKAEDFLLVALAPIGGGESTGSRVRHAGDRIDDRTTNVITVPAGTTITEKDQIEVVDRGMFEVTAVRRRGVEIAREVEVMEAF